MCVYGMLCQPLLLHSPLLNLQPLSQQHRSHQNSQPQHLPPNLLLTLQATSQVTCLSNIAEK